MRKEVLFLSTWYPYPPDNGSKIRVYHVLRALAARHTVHLVTFAPHQGALPNGARYPHPGITPSGDLLALPNLAALGLCASAVVVPRAPFQQDRRRALTALFSPVPRHQAAMQSSLMEAAAQAECDRAARDSRGPVDLAIASTLLTAPVAARLPARCRVIEEHNFSARLMAERFARARGPVRRAAAWLTLRKDIAYERRLFRNFDLVTMVSADDARAVRDLGCATTRIEVVPNGVDTAALRPGAYAVRSGVLAYAGSVTYGPNREAVAWFARHVLPRIRAAVPTASLEVTGATAGADLADLAHAPGVTFLGHVPDPAPVVGSAWACVLPLHTGGGTRLKALEAMALGTPIVSTAKGVEGLDLDPEVHYLAAETPADFARQVIRLFGDPALRAALAGRARTVAERRYDWGIVAGRFVAVMEEVAG